MIRPPLLLQTRPLLLDLLFDRRLDHLWFCCPHRFVFLSDHVQRPKARGKEEKEKTNHPLSVLLFDRRATKKKERKKKKEEKEGPKPVEMMEDEEIQQKGRRRKKREESSTKNLIPGSSQIAGLCV